MRPSGSWSRARELAALLGLAAFLATARGVVATVARADSSPAAAASAQTPAPIEIVPGAGLAASSAGPPPRVEAPESTYHFGTVLQGEQVRHAFTIRNTGQGILVLGTPTASCGCTAANPTRMRLAPGEEAQIAVTLDTHFDKGSSVNTVTVLTNDPKTPKVVMTLEGDVKVQVDAEPSTVAFGKVRHGRTEMRQVLVSDLGTGGGFRINAIKNPNANVRVEQAARTDGKPGAVLNVSLSGSAPLGPFADTITVDTSRAELKIDVFGVVTGDLDVEPPQVSFGIVPHHESAVRILRLTNQGEATVKVLAVETTNQSVSAEVEAVKPGREYKITLALRKNTPDGQLRGELAIHTDDPRQPTLRVPFYAIVGEFKG